MFNSNCTVNSKYMKYLYQLKEMGTRHEFDDYPGVAGKGQVLVKVLPPLARLAQHGLIHDSGPARLVFDQEDMMEANINRDERKPHKQ